MLKITLGILKLFNRKNTVSVRHMSFPKFGLEKMPKLIIFLWNGVYRTVLKKRHFFGLTRIVLQQMGYPARILP
jgi:hypothetical protein